MPKPVGRPKEANPHDVFVGLRLREDEIDKVEQMRRPGQSLSDVLRACIDRAYTDPHNLQVQSIRSRGKPRPSDPAYIARQRRAAKRAARHQAADVATTIEQALGEGESLVE